MKRILLSLITIITILSFANAQQVSEDFETVIVDDAIALTDWINSAQVGTRTWLGKEYDSNKYAQATSYNSTEVNTLYLITPSLNITGASENLSFDVNIGYWTHVALTVFISTDFDGTEGGISTAIWTDITANFTIPTIPTGGYGTFATAGTMDISSYTGSNVYVAFVYDGDDSGAGETTTIQVDNVVVTGSAGISNLSRGFNIYPNPVTSVLNISARSTINSILISNVIGQRIMNIESIDSKTFSLDVENLVNGVYLISIQNIDGTSSITKFIKE